MYLIALEIDLILESNLHNLPCVWIHYDVIIEQMNKLSHYPHAISANDLAGPGCFTEQPIAEPLEGDSVPPSLLNRIADSQP